jgi:hypothetical protein
MFDIDRTVIGSERRRWHPVNPFQMKRHGDNPILPAYRPGSEVFASQSWNWLTERFGYPPQVRLVFDEELATLAARRENFEDL